MDKISTGFAGVLFMLAANADAQTRQSSVERRRVIRVSRGLSKDVPGMGVEFVDLPSDDRAAIEEQLHR